METKYEMEVITELPCLICWKAIGIEGVVKGLKTKEENIQIALCKDHRGVAVSEVNK